MIRIQPTTSNGNRFLIGSDLKNSAEARREVESWMAANDCVLPSNSRHLTVFENGIVVREWVLVERRPNPLPVPPSPTPESVSFLSEWRRRSNISVASLKEKVVALYPSAA